MAAIGTTPAKQDFLVYKGDTFRPGTITLKTGGVAINITGWSAKMDVRTFSGSIIQTLTSTPAAGITITPLLGQIDIVLTAAETNALTPGEYKYDLQLTKSNGDIITVLYGLFTVTSDTTAN